MWEGQTHTMSESKAARNVSYEQMKVILDFMSQHIDFATGSLRSLEGRHMSRQLWRDLMLRLNNCRGGARKTMERWSNYWSDFKNKLKNKVRLLKKRSARGSPERRVRPLTKLEKRALIILGPSFEEKCQAASSLIQECDASSMASDEITKVKLEVEMETTSERDNRRNKSPDYRSKVEASSDVDEESDDNSEEPTVDALYPEWLIEVERKRAEAELSRARAEEARTLVAARAARAAISQAAAIKALARAATIQAEAMARIAAALEKGKSELPPQVANL